MQSGQARQDQGDVYDREGRYRRHGVARDWNDTFTTKSAFAATVSGVGDDRLIGGTVSDT